VGPGGSGTEGRKAGLGRGRRTGEGEEDRWSVANSTADSWKGKGLFNPNTVNEVDSERDRGGGGGGREGEEGRVTEGTSSLCIQ